MAYWNQPYHHFWTPGSYFQKVGDDVSPGGTKRPIEDVSHAIQESSNDEDDVLAVVARSLQESSKGDDATSPGSTKRSMEDIDVYTLKSVWVLV